MDLPRPAPNIRDSRPAPGTHLSRTVSSSRAGEGSSNGGSRTEIKPESSGGLRRGHSDGDVLDPQIKDRNHEETWVDFLRDSARSTGNAGNSSQRHSTCVRDAVTRPEHETAVQRAALMIADRKRRFTENREDYTRRRSASSLPLGPASATQRSGQSLGYRARSSFAIPERSGGHADLSIVDRPISRRPLGSDPHSRQGREITLPRWQPDAEVTGCPICGTSFSFWFRKHHCRKCGRVVCANCSPHRITIPRQFIVQPPQYTNQTSSTEMPAGVEIVDLTGDQDAEALESQQGSRNLDTPQSPVLQIDPALGGGQEVRLCNPCVPDPNPLPHLPFEPPTRLGIHSFPRPEFDRSRIPSSDSSHHSSLDIPRRSSSMRHGSRQTDRSSFNGRDEPPGQEGRRYLDSIIPPLHLRHRHHASASTVPESRYRSLSDLNAPLPPRPPGSRSRPQPQLREEDECPICHHALPPKNPDGNETMRENHVAACIEQHFSSSTPQSARPHPSAATNAAITASAASVSQSQAGGGNQEGERRRSENRWDGNSRENTFGRLGSPRRRVAGMVTYSATEKDCVGEGGEPAECVICFEDFEQGVEMGRLECLCKFHKFLESWDLTFTFRCSSVDTTTATKHIMSLHRVSSMSSYEHVRGSSPARSEHRKMSFNPVGTWVPPAAKEEPVGAFEVSKARRLSMQFVHTSRWYGELTLDPVQVATAVIYCLFAAGIVFGYAALKPVLLRENVYRESCPEVAVRADKTCYEQEIRLNLMFTTAAVATNVCALPVGTVLDRYGPRVCGIIGSLLLAIGSLFFAFAPRAPFDGYIPGYLFLALGGPFVFISSFQLSNTFPRHSGLILALLTGAFDSSSAIFLFYRLIYNASDRTFTPQKFFLVYLIVPVCICIAQILLMPKNSYKTVGELVTHAEDPNNDSRPVDQHISDESRVARLREERRQHRESVVDEITSLLGRKGEEGDKQTQQEERKKEISGVWGALHDRSAIQQIGSAWFILITLFTVIQMVRINYFVATIRTQYEHLLSDHDKAVHVNNVFDVALPLGGVIAIPMIGLVLDNTSTPFVLGLLVSVATAIGILGVLPYLWAAYANIALFVLYRPLYYTAVSDYAAKVFGFHTFGKVYGLIICLAGLLNFVQSALDAATHMSFGGDPVPVNALLLVLALVVGVVLVGFVGWKSRTMKRDKLEDEAEGATERLMPEPNGEVMDARR
ncbi:MAG: hypothetical protein Q9216_001246 [Gyalolechia sp. 2 TL-2023]